jgi:hypothetical protein
MSELHERFTDGLFEIKWQPGVQSELHRRGENKQRCRAREQESEAEKINQVIIELFNGVPVFAIGMPESKLAGKSEPKNLDTTLSFLEMIAILLEKIVDGVKAIFPKRKEMPL